MRTLLVADHGPAVLGYPFHTLFDKAERAVKTEQLKTASALLLWGGTDISPSLYGEKPAGATETGSLPTKRDLFEWTLIREAVSLGVPIIGVCRGAQLLCAYDGGKLAQDIGGHKAGHELLTKDGEVLWAAANHHQMMLPLPDNVCHATTTKPLHSGFYFGHDNTINHIPHGFLEPEVVYFPRLKALGIQPHPEWMSEEEPFVEWCLTTVREVLLDGVCV